MYISMKVLKLSFNLIMSNFDLFVNALLLKNDHFTCIFAVVQYPMRILINGKNIWNTKGTIPKTTTGRKKVMMGEQLMFPSNYMINAAKLWKPTCINVKGFVLKKELQLDRFCSAWEDFKWERDTFAKEINRRDCCGEGVISKKFARKLRKKCWGIWTIKEHAHLF